MHGACHLWTFCMAHCHFEPHVAVIIFAPADATLPASLNVIERIKQVEHMCL